MEAGTSGATSGQSPGAQQGAQYPETIRNNPHLPQPRGPRLTQEEINVLEECNTESFWYRCVPLAMAFGGTTAYMVKTGHLKPHPRYGATLKTLGAVFVAYVTGKLSYHNTCQQKILEKIPHSQLAQSIRKNRGIKSVYEEAPVADTGFDPEYSRKEKMHDAYSSMDSSSKGLDDNLRPSLDREVKPDVVDESSADPQRTLTYNELRQRNRQEYEQSMVTSPNSPFRQRPFPVPRPGAPPSAPAESSPSPPAPSGSRAIWDTPQPQTPGRAFDGSRGQKKNEYGDVWDNN